MTQLQQLQQLSLIILDISIATTGVSCEHHSGTTASDKVYCASALLWSSLAFKHKSEVKPDIVVSL